jgi:hypothetical protein
MRRGKVFRFYTRRDVVLYDGDLQEVPYRDVLDDGWVVYDLKAIWNEKLNEYVSRVYYMVEYSEEPFVRYVSKMMCVGDMSFYSTDNYRCIGGRVMSKMAMWVMDKRFKELCQLL